MSSEYNSASPEQYRRVSVASSTMSPEFTTPKRERQYYNTGSPLQLTPSRRAQVPAYTVSQGLQIRAFLPDQYGQSPGSSNGRGSFSSTLRAPTVPYNPTAPSITGIPEDLSVQEFAYRQGQHDRNSPRDRVPPNPFAKHYDFLWAEAYRQGKLEGGVPIQCPELPSNASHQNFEWPVLINAYTQDLEHPNGSVDLEYAREICEMALGSMESLLQQAYSRIGEWKRLVIDIPNPCHQAMMHFPDLMERYEQLKKASHAAQNPEMRKMY